MLALPCTRHCLRLPKTIDSRPHFEDNKCLNQHHHFRPNVNFPQRGKMFRLPPTIPPVSVSVSDRFFSEMPHFVGIVSHLLRLFHRDHRRCRHCRRRRRLPGFIAKLCHRRVHRQVVGFVQSFVTGDQYYGR